MKRYLETHQQAIASVGALIAFAVATIYFIIVPEESSRTAGIHRIILIYGHSLCWFLLSIAGIVWAIKKKNRWSIYLAYVALIVYILFLGTLLFVK